jgi:hypothetical protein
MMIVIGFDSSDDEEAMKCLGALQDHKLLAYPVEPGGNDKHQLSGAKVSFKRIKISTVYRKE